VALLFMTPSITTFYDGITSRPMWSALNQRLLPQEKWFGVIGPRSQVAVTPAPAGGAIPQTTGSIPETATQPAQP
jgi:hypothetical protein